MGHRQIQDSADGEIKCASWISENLAMRLPAATKFLIGHRQIPDSADGEIDGAAWISENLAVRGPAASKFHMGHRQILLDTQLCVSWCVEFHMSPFLYNPDTIP
jgi:hypothetical protein